MKQNKAQVEFFAIVFLVVTVLVGIFALSQQDSTYIDDMGKDQNQILNSYTVAEGAKMYIEKSAEYSVDYAIDESTYCTDGNKEDFIDKFDVPFRKYIYKNNLPTENMGLNIEFPFDILHQPEYDITGNILEIDMPYNLIVTNDNTDFKIKTEISADLEFDISELC